MMAKEHYQIQMEKRQAQLALLSEQLEKDEETNDFKKMVDRQHDLTQGTSFNCAFGDLRSKTMSNEQISSVFKYLVVKCPFLKNLSITVHLRFFPTEILELPYLEVLNVSNNFFTSLPEEISKLTFLTNLQVNHNRLIALPAAIGQLKKLTFLGVSCNKLTFLPAELFDLPSLEELNIDGNYLTSLSPDLGKLTSLKNLNISNNRLSSLPVEINQLLNLKQIIVNNNFLTSLPPGIGKLSSLYLGLSHNHLTSLPAELGARENFLSLELRDNPWNETFQPLVKDKPQLGCYLKDQLQKQERVTQAATAGFFVPMGVPPKVGSRVGFYLNGKEGKSVACSRKLASEYARFARESYEITKKEENQQAEPKQSTSHDINNNNSLNAAGRGR